MMRCPASGGHCQVVPLSTPVVLIGFNRPELTQRVFNEIRRVRPSTLLFVTDGPRPNRPGEAERVAAVQSLVSQVDWDCNVRCNFADRNLGIRERFASAFRWVFEEVEEAIVLEHDCVPHPDFFAFCAALLERYRDDPRIAWIGGTNPMRRWPGDGSYLFNRINWVWGWASWRRAWQSYDIACRGFRAFEHSGGIRRITPHRRIRRGFGAVMDLAATGQWDNWDVQSTYLIWSQQALAIHPRVNLVSNIGFDAEAANTRWPSDPLANLPTEPLGPLVHPSVVQSDDEFDLACFKAHYRWMRRIALFRKLRRLPFYSASRSVYRRISGSASPGL
jgi:hypothetical protein